LAGTIVQAAAVEKADWGQRFSSKSPSRSLCVLLLRPSALITMTELPRTDPLLLVSTMVSTRLPSAATTVISLRVRSNRPDPTASVWISRVRPAWLVVETVRSRSEPSALRSEIVMVRLPSALLTRSSVWSATPLPSRSRAMVTDRPSALVVVTVRLTSTPATSKSETVLLRLPSALTASTIVLVWSKIPFPLWSNFRTRESPFALDVLRVSFAREPSRLNALTSMVVEPSAFDVTDRWVA